MKIVLNRSSVVKHVTVYAAKQRKKDESTKVTVRSSTTSGTIAPEVWIMSGLLLSLVQQIVGVSLQQRPEAKQDINQKKEHYD